MKSDDSHTAYSHIDLSRREKRQCCNSLPCTNIVNVAGSDRIPSQSTILIYLSLYKSSTIMDPGCTGVVAMSQIPFVFAFAMKNNLLGAFVGLGYEKINHLHRFAGRAIVILVGIHSTGFMYKWTLNGEFVAKASEPSIKWAFVALVNVNIMALTSATSMRQASYRLFICTHVIGFTLFLIAVCFHNLSSFPTFLQQLFFTASTTLSIL